MVNCCFIAEEPGSSDPDHELNSDHSNDNTSAETDSNHHGGHKERYSVFNFDFSSVQAAYVVSIWIFVASFAKIGL